MEDDIATIFFEKKFCGLHDDMMYKSATPQMLRLVQMPGS